MGKIILMLGLLISENLYSQIDTSDYTSSMDTSISVTYIKWQYFGVTSPYYDSVHYVVMWDTAGKIDRIGGDTIRAIQNLLDRWQADKKRADSLEKAYIKLLKASINFTNTVPDKLCDKSNPAWVKYYAVLRKNGYYTNKTPSKK